MGGFQMDAAAVFHTLDTDGNGSLSFVELSCRLSDLGFDEDDITQLFQNMDTNGDGEITMEEFEAGYEEYLEYMDDDLPMCIEEAPTVIKGRANPHRPSAMPEDAGAGLPEEEEKKKKKKKKSKSSSTSSTSSCSSSDLDDSDDDFPMCV